MKKNLLIIFSVIALMAVLYFIELSKVKPGNKSKLPTLDNLQSDLGIPAWHRPFGISLIGSKCHVRRKCELLYK